MATTKKTQMPQNWVSEKPETEEAELNGNHQDDSGRVGSPRGRKEEGGEAKGGVAQCPVSPFSVFSLSLHIAPV